MPCGNNIQHRTKTAANITEDQQSKEIFELVNNIFKTTYDEFKKDDKMNLRSNTKESFEDTWTNMMPLLTASVSAIMIAMEKKSQRKDDELNAFKNHCQDKILKQHIQTDKQRHLQQTRQPPPDWMQRISQQLQELWQRI